jgi:molybdenum cofactor synthesis domain-containing protein
VSPPSPQVTILIIGDEVLGAKITDTNGPYLLERLNAVGAEVRELRIIGDAIAEIEGALREALDRGDRVITTGGVGPTHDDRTMEAVARALGAPLVIHPQLESLLSERIGGRPPTGPLRRMCRVPEGAELVEAEKGFPAVMAGPVTVLPGVPELVRFKFPAIEGRFASPRRPCGALFVDLPEAKVAVHLETLLEEQPDLKIGSYPRMAAVGFRVIVTIEHESRARVEAAMQGLAGAFEAADLRHRELPFRGLRDAV